MAAKLNGAPASDAHASEKRISDLIIAIKIPSSKKLATA
jgi:hypothetical protein